MNAQTNSQINLAGSAELADAPPPYSRFKTPDFTSEEISDGLPKLWIKMGKGAVPHPLNFGDSGACNWIATKFNSTFDPEEYASAFFWWQKVGPYRADAKGPLTFDDLLSGFYFYLENFTCPYVVRLHFREWEVGGCDLGDMGEFFDGQLQACLDLETAWLSARVPATLEKRLETAFMQRWGLSSEWAPGARDAFARAAAGCTNQIWGEVKRTLKALLAPALLNGLREILLRVNLCSDFFALTGEPAAAELLRKVNEVDCWFGPRSGTVPSLLGPRYQGMPADMETAEEACRAIARMGLHAAYEPAGVSWEWTQ
jgi:hypothetical protein